MNEVKTAGTGKEIRVGGFMKAYHSISKQERKVVKKEICDLCWWGNDTFMWKLSGRRLFRIYEADKITEYFAQRGIDAWTGEPINNK